jgi:Bifunctional DNA primase/polymerase, N-terminal/AAA domain
VSRLADAQKLDSFGLNVLPARGKKPIVDWKQFQHERATPHLVEWFGSPNGSKPLNLWVACGLISHVVVLDCDGAVAKHYWGEKLGDLLDATTCVQTARGLHYWFRITAGEWPSWSEHEGGLDFEVRGEGGGVIAPPSVHESGVAYRWVRNLRQLQDAPEALRGPTTDSPVAVRSKLADLLAGGPDDPKKGNVWMAQVAGHYAKWIPVREAFGATIRNVNAGLDDPIAEAEIAKLIDSIWATEHEKADAELEKERQRRRVRRTVDAEESAADFHPPESLPSLVEDLAETPADLPTTIEGLHRTGFNALIAAAAKTGKTELGVEITRSLVDGGAFLGRFAVSFEGRVAFVQYELDKAQMIDTFRLHGIRHADRISTLNLRGLRLPIESPIGRSWFVGWLREHDIRALVIDPLARAFTGDEDKVTEMHPFLDALDGIKREAGVRDLFVIHHFGHGAERARGTSRLQDWPDALWLYTRHHDDRFLAVEGRTGAGPLAESKLEFDPKTHRLRLVGGSRREGKAEEDDGRRAFRKGEVRRFVEANPGCSQTRIEEGVEGRADVLRGVLKELVEAGTVRREGNRYFSVEEASS